MPLVNCEDACCSQLFLISFLLDNINPKSCKILGFLLLINIIHFQSSIYGSVSQPMDRGPFMVRELLLEVRDQFLNPSYNL